MKLWCFALLAALTVCVSANDLTTKSGVVYKDYSINGPSVDGLVIFHELGGATVPYAELPDDLRTKYKADEEKAAATLKEREEQRKEVKKRQAEEAARIQEEQLKREKEFQELRGLFGYYLGEEISESDILKKEKNISLKAKRKDWGATDCVVKLTKSGKIYFINKLFTEISDPLPLAEKIKTNIPAIRVQSSDNKTSIKATARVDNRYLEADVS